MLAFSPQLAFLHRLFLNCSNDLVIDDVYDCIKEAIDKKNNECLINKLRPYTLFKFL